MKPISLIAGLTLSVGSLFVTNAAHAIVASVNTNANALAAAAAANASGFTVNSATLSGHAAAGGASSGTFTNASNTYGIDGGIILSTGNVLNYGDGPSTSTGRSTRYGASSTAGQAATLSAIGGNASYYDVTELNINFTTSTGDVFFKTVFGSEEYPEYVGEFVDAFGLFIDGVNIAFVGGKPVNIDHPDMTKLPGTELDGILCPAGANGCTPGQTFSMSGLDKNKQHTLTFIIGDRGDDQLDTTIYISSLGGTVPQDVPEPGALGLMGLGLAGLLAARRRKQV